MGWVFCVAATLGTKSAVRIFVAVLPFERRFGLEWVVLCMCFVLFLLCETALLVLECWFEEDSWIEVGAFMGCRVCGFNDCC